MKVALVSFSGVEHQKRMTGFLQHCLTDAVAIAAKQSSNTKIRTLHHPDSNSCDSEADEQQLDWDKSLVHWVNTESKLL